MNDQIRHHILQTAREKFSAHGFSKVTADEIAASLGMSKKTLYKHFASKSALLEEVVETTLQEMKTGLLQIIDNDELEFVRKLQHIMAHVGGHLSTHLTKPLLRDLKRSAPELWLRFEAFREEQISRHFTPLIEEGISRGIFRKDIDKQFVVMVYFNAVQNIINPETLAHLPVTASEAFEAILKILFEGILTEEGRKKFLAKTGNKTRS